MIEKVRFPPTWSLFDIHSLDSTVTFHSHSHVLIENKIKFVEFDVWARSDSIQVVQSLSKAGGAENEACRSETFEVWREKGKCVTVLVQNLLVAAWNSHDMIFWWAAPPKDGFPLSSTKKFLDRMAEGLHCVWICFEKFTIWPQQFQTTLFFVTQNRHDINFSRHCCSLGVFSPSIPWALRCGVVWERGSRAENYCKLINATDKKRYF